MATADSEPAVFCGTTLLRLEQQRGLMLFPHRQHLAAGSWDLPASPVPGKGVSGAPVGRCGEPGPPACPQPAGMAPEHPPSRAMQMPLRGLPCVSPGPSRPGGVRYHPEMARNSPGGHPGSEASCTPFCPRGPGIITLLGPGLRESSRASGGGREPGAPRPPQQGWAWGGDLLLCTQGSHSGASPTCVGVLHLL